MGYDIACWDVDCNPVQGHVVASSAGPDNAKPLHKPRVVWTDELHQRFLRAIDAAGSDEAAVPTVILKVRLPVHVCNYVTS